MTWAQPVRQMKCAQESASTVTQQVKQRWIDLLTARRVVVAVVRVGNFPATARVAAQAVVVLVVVEQGQHLLTQVAKVLRRPSMLLRALVPVEVRAFRAAASRLRHNQALARPTLRRSPQEAHRPLKRVQPRNVDSWTRFRTE